MHRLKLLLFGLLTIFSLYSQTETRMVIPEPGIQFSPDEAGNYIRNLTDNAELWRSQGDSLRLSLYRLLDNYFESIDSVEQRLVNYPVDSFSVERETVSRYDTVSLYWLNDSTFIRRTDKIDREPLLYKEKIVQIFKDSVYTRLVQPEVNTTKVSDEAVESEGTTEQADSLQELAADTLSDPEEIVLVPDTITETQRLLVGADTLSEVVIDTAWLRSMNVELYRYSNHQISPLPGEVLQGAKWKIDHDTGKLIFTREKQEWVGKENTPFYVVPGEKSIDSLFSAAYTLLKYTYQRDSVLIYLNDIDGDKTAFWLTAGENDPYRYWVKNYNNDSITVWLGNPSRDVLSLILERDVNFTRLKEVQVDSEPVFSGLPDLSLAKVQSLQEIPVYWDYSFSTSFSLNQTYLSNWAKGGENSFSSLLDIQAGALYTDKKSKTKWDNSGRLKFGNIITENYGGLRTNTDMLEFNSQYNKELRKRMDLSAIFYMKNQIAKGYNFPNDSVIVSRFLNPGTFTIGIGVEYKPFKKTSMNFSLLSYKNTFVLDTAKIDQTNHGIDADKRARQEMGGQLVVKNSISILDGLEIDNKIRLFSNYLSNPGNVDVDWEIDLEKKISHYFTILMNFHMIYDDDVRFTVFDDADQPVLLGDGTVKKVPKLQFKQFLGLTFLFKF